MASLAFIFYNRLQTSSSRINRGISQESQSRCWSPIFSNEITHLFQNKSKRYVHLRNHNDINIAEICYEILNPKPSLKWITISISVIIQINSTKSMHSTKVTVFILCPRSHKKYMRTLYDVLLHLDLKTSLKGACLFIMEIKVIWKVLEILSMAENSNFRDNIPSADLVAKHSRNKSLMSTKKMWI